jgi:short subunit dehydrogenase-like uncharacterized protein
MVRRATPVVLLPNIWRDRDPGYGSTSKMIAESALCLVRDVQGEGGIWTPGALMGAASRKRLTERARLTFSAH